MRRGGPAARLHVVEYVLAGSIFADPLPQGIRVELLAPRLLKRLLMLLPSSVAPPAIASAIKMISIAYSVAVAARSTPHRRLTRPSMSNPSSRVCRVTTHGERPRRCPYRRASR